MNLPFDPQQIEALMRHIGSWMKAEQGKLADIEVETKSLNSLVSYVDQTAETQLVEGLKAMLPESGFLAEESGDARIEAGWNWVIDPLDGTTNFLQNLPTYAISVALLYDDTLQFAAVWEAGGDDYFQAIQGQGATCNGHKLSIANGPQMKDGLIATGFPYYDFSAMDGYLDVLRRGMKGSRGIRRFGSAATDLAWTAGGKFQAFFEHGLSPWDIAAGILLVREAGGWVSDFSNRNLSDAQLLTCRSIVAGNPQAHAELVQWTDNAFS